MRLTLHAFKPDAPERTIYRPGVDYLAHEYEVSPDEAFAFVGRLRDPRDSFRLDGPGGCLLVVWKEKDLTLWVELQCPDFWAISAVSADAAKEIIGMVARGERFDDYVPTAGRIWDAYGFPGDNPSRAGEEKEP